VPRSPFSARSSGGGGLGSLVAVARTSPPPTAQGNVVEECQQGPEAAVDIAIRNAPTTPNPLSKGHGLFLSADDRSVMCAAMA